jgi:hypothetical protein
MDMDARVRTPKTARRRTATLQGEYVGSVEAPMANRRGEHEAEN